MTENTEQDSNTKNILQRPDDVDPELFTRFQCIVAAIDAMLPPENPHAFTLLVAEQDAEEAHLMIMSNVNTKSQQQMIKAGLTED